MENLYEFDEEYRDTIATVDEEGKRIWVYPKKPSGKFHNLRIVVSITLLAILFGLPLIKIDGDPFMLIDVFERKFIIFGIHLWPQDFSYCCLIHDFPGSFCGVVYCCFWPRLVWLGMSANHIHGNGIQKN